MESAIGTRGPYTLLTMSERSPNAEREIRSQRRDRCHHSGNRMAPEHRVGVFARDPELRTWLVDELGLLSPALAVQSLDALDAASLQLLIVDLDALTLADEARLRELAPATPVIAIGAPTKQLATTPFFCVLEAELTSKQLKRAVRESLYAPA
jgi:hypothetical protein